ncbi:hypothetical protein QO002_001095 [Pararhizobium capsulatum DSM 1112]|uniref:Uncharacterized protein n=1 Tax=Pararhizobium capsulatum DSM 1112 TaxID=1121113 RepID=A0ABU0BL39_9HYPH|nr:hypothetical protein [Pararhizobium capsulatum]MDQ0318957.1 hypothetical protein [Pararhizobium capsulatum DSM 1112]
MKFFVTTPVLQKMKFDGIEGRAEFTILPPDVQRPLTQHQEELIAKYRLLNDGCQGAYPGPETDKVCEQRDKVNLSKFGICFGMKEQTLADSQWHACRVSSYGYEIGSESFRVTCRPGESITVSLGIFALEDLTAVAKGHGVVKLRKSELSSTYSVIKVPMDDGDRASINYDFDATGANLLRDLYDGRSAKFPIGSGSISVSIGSGNDALRDEIAHAYSVCK